MKIIDFRNFLIDLLQGQGIQVLFFRAPYDDFPRFDLGLRSLLYEHFDYSNLLNIILCQKGTVIHRIYDSFATHYYFFTLPVWDNPRLQEELCCVGPFLLKDEEVPPTDILDKNHLPLLMLRELKEFYNSIPVFHDSHFLETELITFVKHYYGCQTVQIDDSCMMDTYTDFSPSHILRNETETMSAALMEERYHYEDELLDAVSHGDYTKALEMMHAFSRFRMTDRPLDSIREQQNILIVLNTLMRKSVQQAKIHPIHIDTVSKSFSRRIESSVSLPELEQISHDMVRKYCMIVQNHSLRNYSHVIVNVLNYIDTHITEPLPLNLLAAHASVNASYLSAQFKRELGQTVTEYINEKRLRSSLVLLITTSLQIQEIAEQVGIFDENYFSRIFKKHYQMTPREYRKIMQH